MRRRLLLAAAATAVLGPAAAAHANTTCVGGPGCFPTLAAAVNDANAAGDADRIEVHAGTHQVPATIFQTAAGGPLEIDGAGRSATFLELTAPAANHALKLLPSATISDLTLNLGAGDSRLGLDVTGGKIARVNVLGPNAGQSSGGVHLRDGADADQLEVMLGPSPNIASIAIGTDDDGETKLTRVKATADYGILAIGQGDGGTTVVHSSRVQAKYHALDARGMRLVADGVSADIVGYPGAAVRVGSLWPHASAIDLKHVTIRGPIDSRGIDISPSTDHASAVVTAREVAISGPSTHARLWGAAGTVSTLDMAWSAIEPQLVTEMGPGITDVVQGPGMVTGVDLKLPAAGDPYPPYDSPLIDAGEPGPALAPANLLDLLSNARVRDGNGDGTARREIGAIERLTPIKIPTGPPPTLP